MGTWSYGGTPGRPVFSGQEKIDFHHARMRTARCSGLAAIALLTCCPHVRAGTAPPTPPAAVADPFAGSLTGDWGGLRRSLADHGISLQLAHTQFFQGMPAGDGYDDWDFGGRADAFVNLDTEKLGLWQGGGLRTHLEYRHGDLRGTRGGALWPVNTGMVLPLAAREEIVASSLFLTQRIGSRGLLMAGKINAVDLLAADPFLGGWGTQRFQNIAFVAPPSGVVPPTIMGAVFSLQTAPLSWTLMVFDPNDRTSDYFPGDLFEDGVNISLGATWSGELAGRQSSLGLTGTFSTKDGIDFNDILLPSDLQTSTRDGAWNLALQFTHALTGSAGRPLGFYLKAAIADGNPNPIQASFVGGLSGKGLLPGRPDDAWGLGAFHYNFSDDLQNAVSPLIAFDDEFGVELFYRCQVTPWWHLTADLQWIDPARGDFADALVLGLRSHISF